MTYQDALTVLKSITVFYHNFSVTEEKAKQWAEVLTEYDFMEVTLNLRNYVKVNRFPPTLSDLIELKDEITPKKNIAYIQATETEIERREREAKELLIKLEGERF